MKSRSGKSDVCVGSRGGGVNRARIQCILAFDFFNFTEPVNYKSVRLDIRYPADIHGMRSTYLIRYLAMSVEISSADQSP